MNLNKIIPAFFNSNQFTKILSLRACHSLVENVSKATNVEPPKHAEKASEVDKLYKTVELQLKGNDPAVLNSYAKFATLAGKHFDIQSKTWDLRKHKLERFTVYKSVHIFKRHKAQYELRTYFRFVQFKHLTGSTADTLLEYLQRNLPEGVACKTSKIELQTMPDYLGS